MNEINVFVETQINLTEDSEKVRKSLENLIYNCKFEVETQDQKSIIKAKAKGLEALEKIRNLIRKKRILNAARKIFFNGIQNHSITFFLNKQVAYVGNISFSNPLAESPLGSIKVKINCDDPVGLIEWLASKTV
jgi:predicted RNA binding protein with dsRBD fold (UPF0201 family)